MSAFRWTWAICAGANPGEPNLASQRQLEAETAGPSAQAIPGGNHRQVIVASMEFLRPDLAAGLIRGQPSIRVSKR
jgi:hypothetical protein